jgi:hypothetical protein
MILKEPYLNAPFIKPDIDDDVKGNITAKLQPPSIELALVANAQAGTVASAGCGLTLCPWQH